MAGRIPDAILDDILSRVDLAELIAGYIPLKRAGRNFKALCPFHHEKTPSFMVSVDRQIYHCFGCGAGGNAIGFLMQYERLEFLEAVEFLAKKVGVAIPETRQQDQKTSGLTTQLYRANELAALFYEASLQAPSAASARRYLLGRGVREESIRELKLGWAADRWDGLINHLRSKGLSLALLEKAGLILAKDGGGYYDRFRNRIVFPIFDIRARAIAFGGRVLPDAGGRQADSASPKYMNSPETPVYSKGKNLYGLNLAKDEIRQSDYCVIVEGYMDFLMPFQEGIKNIVASLGTALTSEQARLIKRYTHNVVMVYDADDAGQMGTLRTLDIFIDEGINVKVASLPQGLDPDQLVRKRGVEAFRERIAQASSLFDYKLRVLKTRHNIKEADGKARIASEMLPTIQRFKNAIEKAEYIKRLSQELEIAEEYVLQELQKVKADRPYSPNTAPLTKAAPLGNPAEKLLVKLMLEEKELIGRIRDMLEPSDFQDARVSKIVSILFDLAEQGRSIETNCLINHLPEEGISQFICESALMPEVSVHNKERVIEDCVKRLKQEKARLKRQRLHEAIKEAQNLGDEERLHSLMQEFQRAIEAR